jgi:hypothetical protein
MTSPLASLAAALPGVQIAVSPIPEPGYVWTALNTETGEAIVIHETATEYGPRVMWCERERRFTRHDHNGRRLACACEGREG